MATRTSEVEWKGNLREGSGVVWLGSGAFEGEFSHASRFENGAGTNPEELIGAAHAACFSMELVSGLVKAGYEPSSVHTKASVTVERIDGKVTITTSRLSTEADVPGIDELTFEQQATAAKEGCAVSKALAGVEITLNAKLLQTIPLD